MVRISVRVTLKVLLTSGVLHAFVREWLATSHLLPKHNHTCNGLP